MNDLCRQLEWDSQFFQRRIARIEGDRLDKQSLDPALRWCKEKGIECLYFLCSPDDDNSVAVAEAAGFHLVDIRSELNWRIQATSESSPSFVRQYQESDLAMLQKIASQAYTNTRFNFDNHFPSEQVADLYKVWITTSCQNEEHKVFVASSENKIVGFITCFFDTAEIGRIGLLGLSEEVKGRGYGRQLVQAAQQYFFSTSADEVRVVTQGRNLAAQRLYQSCGFRTYKLGLWYHKWF